jgi:flagellin
MAQRVLTLATQGANGTMGNSDRNAIRSEMRQLMIAVDSIASRTKYSGISVLNATAISLQSSNVTADVITVSASALAKIGVGTPDSSSGYAVIGGAYTGSSTTAGALMTKINVGADDALSLTTMNNIATDAAAYITALSTQRGLLGAAQNQIEYSVSNITELSSNLTAARSTVQDTDYASETAALTKGQILQQAATAMLAQANQMPNVILSLLK